MQKNIIIDLLFNKLYLKILLKPNFVFLMFKLYNLVYFKIFVNFLKKYF